MTKLPGDINDDKSPGEDREQPGTGKMSHDPESPELPESKYHFDFRPDTSIEGSNPADHEPIPLPERNESSASTSSMIPTIWTYTYSTESQVV